MATFHQSNSNTKSLWRGRNISTFGFFLSFKIAASKRINNKQAARNVHSQRILRERQNYLDIYDGVGINYLYNDIQTIQVNNRHCHSNNTPYYRECKRLNYLLHIILALLFLILIYWAEFSV